MSDKKLVVYKANQVVEAGYRLTLNELRVVLACIGQVRSKEELLVTDEFELSAKDFAEFFSVSSDRAYHALLEVTESLFNRYVVVDNPDVNRPKIKQLKMRWISSIKYLTDDGKVILRFSQDMLPYLSELKGSFTKYDIEHIGNMTCIYAIRLYELLMQWKTTGKREIEIDWLKKQFEIEELYPDMHNFKKRVIDPAVKDINEHSNFNVMWEQRKTGRRVTHLIFTFAEKKVPKLASVQKKIKATPQSPEKSAAKIDNVAYFADLHQKYGESADEGIPDDVKEILKAQGQW